jgi:PAS domain S-box-containing protein
MEKTKVLLVDDIEMNLILLEEMLEDLDLHIIRAQSGFEALELASQNKFAMVLLDVQMPDMDGFETAEKLYQIEGNEDLPIIFVTAVNIEEQYVLKGYQFGAVDYIIKPFDPVLLISKVKMFCKLLEQNNLLDLKNQELLRIEKERSHYKIYLEETLKTRTEKLLNLNKTLKDEVLQWKQKAQSNMGRYSIINCFENSYLGMIVLTENGNWLEVNKRFCDLIGNRKENIINTDWNNLIHESSLSEFKVNLNLIIESEQNNYSGNIKLKNVKGDIVNTNFNIQLIKSDNQKNNLIFFTIQSPT